ncbi:hypothetical protein PIROE2DRAFT_64090 [Piromyces sp. E2]|nr:hypothetical protein PIROE2DRAFT_64090 [Piromyces sp. E2]|eukprot:OUM58936.1 hypothetical protein PIROE2DRAFT_64090 [Piromyces sp. E2]
MLTSESETINEQTSVKDQSLYTEKKKHAKSINEKSSIFAESIFANSIFSDDNNDINETINAMSLNEKFIKGIPEENIPEDNDEQNNQIISESILREKSVKSIHDEKSNIIKSSSQRSRVERQQSYNDQVIDRQQSFIDQAAIEKQPSFFEGEIDRRPSFINNSIIEEEDPKFINEDMIDENDKHYMERSIIIEEPIRQSTIIDPTITSFEKSKINKSRIENTSCDKNEKPDTAITHTDKRSSKGNKSITSEANVSTVSKSNKSLSVDYSITSDADRSTTSVKRKILSMLFIPNSRTSHMFGSGSSVRSSRFFTPSKPVEKKKRTQFTDLPDSAIQLIFKYIGETYSIEFKHTCQKTYRVGNHPDTIAKWLYYYYDPKVLTIPESDQQIAFKNRLIVTNDVIASIVNNIDENVVEDFDDNLKNSLTAYALKKDDLHLLQALFKPFCFNVEVGLVSIACQNQNRTSQEFITYLFEKDFILPKSTFFEACLRYNTYVINCYLNYNDITHKEIDDYFKSVEKRPFHPMVAAARSGDMSLIRNLIENIGCSVSLFGYYAFIKAISHNKLNVAKYIFNLYPQLDLNDNEMMNIVSKAAERGRLETIRLIKYVYDKRYGKSRSVNVFRKPGILANSITASALAGQLECCVWLMEREKKYINAEYANRILDCFSNHLKSKSHLPLLHRARFLQYLSRFPTDFKGKTGYDLLKIAIGNDDVDSVIVLIDNGVDFRVDNEQPLQLACGLDKGAQPNKYVIRTLKKGVVINGNIIRLDREKKNEVTKLLNSAQSSKRFSLSFQK